MVENPYPDRIAYCLHGWYHEQGEDVPEKKLIKWQYDKVYRAPYWILSDHMYSKLIKNGYKIMLNYTDVDENRKGIYFDWNIKDAPDLRKNVLFGHGHIDNGVNGIYEMIENIKRLPKDTRFKFLKDFPL